MTTLVTTASDINVDVLLNCIANDLRSQAFDTFEYHLNSMTDDLEGVDYQIVRDEVFNAVSKRLVIDFK